MIELSGVTKRFGRAAGVEGVSLTVRPGLAVVIQGPSGSGKTTLLRLIAGLEAPDSGDIRIGGQAALPPHRRGIGMVFQHPALWPHMTVSENVRFALRHGGGAWLDELLQAVELAPLAGRYPHEISGGEAARAALARALAPRPRRLLLDEPLAHLDDALKERCLEAILRYAAAFRASIVYVTHDHREAATLRGRVYRMQNGRLLAAVPEQEAIDHVLW